MTLRENAQFIDELRQHYRRLDGLLVERRDRITTGELCDEVNQCVLNLRRLLFGGIADPNFPPSPGEIEKRKLGAAAVASPVKAKHTMECDIKWAGDPLPGEPRRCRCRHDRRLRLVEDAPTAPMSVHDPAEDLEVIP